MPDPRRHVVVVDDDASVLKAIARHIKLMGHMPLPFDNAADALAELSRGAGDCLLVDLQMPGMSGLELQDALLDLGRRLPVVFLSGRGSIPATVSAMRAGAVDFLEKPVEFDVLAASLSAALDAGEARAREESELQDLRQRIQALTTRQRDVFDQMLSGSPNKVIAFKLGISERTVKTHRHAIMEKLDVRSIAELCFLAARLGLPHPDGAGPAA